MVFPSLSLLLAKTTNQLQIAMFPEKKNTYKYLSFMYLAPFCSSAIHQICSIYKALGAEQETQFIQHLYPTIISVHLPCACLFQVP